MDFNHCSSDVSQALQKGDLSLVQSLSGNKYFITGVVVKGKMLGRKLGFPTANLEISPKTPLLLPNGVYAAEVLYKNKTFLGMANIGTRPTVSGKGLTVEVNLFDFDEDIYGQVLSVNFIKRIRDEKKFRSLEELTHEISRDKVIILELFSSIYHSDPES